MVSKQVVGIPSPPHKQAFLERQIPDNIPFIITPSGYTPDLQSPGQKQFSERTVLRFSGEKKRSPNKHKSPLPSKKPVEALVWWEGGLPAILCSFTQSFQTQYHEFETHGKFLWLHESCWENLYKSSTEAGGKYNWQLILRKHR